MVLHASPWFSWSSWQLGFPGCSAVKNLPANGGAAGSTPWREGNGNPFQFLAWEIPWTQELAAYSSWGCKRVEHDLVTKQQPGSYKQTQGISHMLSATFAAASRNCFFESLSFGLVGYDGWRELPGDSSPLWQLPECLWYQLLWSNRLRSLAKSSFIFSLLPSPWQASCWFWLISYLGYMEWLLFSWLNPDWYTGRIRWLLKSPSVQFSSVTQSCPTLRPHGLQHTRPPCPLPTPRVYPNSCP